MVQRHILVQCHVRDLEKTAKEIQEFVDPAPDGFSAPMR
jgi:hypothetical protein